MRWSRAHCSVALLALLAGVILVGCGETGTTPPSLADPTETYDPVVAGESLPAGYRIGLDRDQIVPVYRPEFVRANDVDWPGDMLVVGVVGNEVAKAYPVTHLNQREMVVDSLEGIPILVTW